MQSQSSESDREYGRQASTLEVCIVIINIIYHSYINVPYLNFLSFVLYRYGIL